MPKVIRFKCEYSDKSGCEGDIQEWRLEGYDPVPAFILCDKHAAEFGFCLTCGAFVGGTEDVFRTGQEGLCFDCYLRFGRERERERDFDDDTDDDDYEED